jgi:hypothetical protein
MSPMTLNGHSGIKFKTLVLFKILQDCPKDNNRINVGFYPEKCWEFFYKEGKLH